MSSPALTTALMAAQSLGSDPDTNPVPEWVHLLPLGSVATDDRRGPYLVEDAERIIANSLQIADQLPIDENHAIDLAAPKGAASPARGWIVELQARQDGIWGRVNWSHYGMELLKERAYRALSPVIRHDKAKRVHAILRASLVNRPNLRGLTALNSTETDDMSLLSRLATALNLAQDADEDAVLAAVDELKASAETGTALQSTLSKVGVALGLSADAEADAVLNAAEASGTEEDGETIVALQSTVRDLSAQVTQLQEGGKRGKAEAVVDQAIREKRVGISKASRDRFIAMHMKDPEGTDELIAGLPTLDASGTSVEPPAAAGDKIALNSSQRQAAKLLGLSAEDYAKTLASERSNEEAL